MSDQTYPEFELCPCCRQQWADDNIKVMQERASDLDRLELAGLAHTLGSPDTAPDEGQEAWCNFVRMVYRLNPEAGRGQSH